MWEVGMMINATCNDGFFVRNKTVKRRTIECTENGWEELEGCVQGLWTELTQKDLIPA